MIEQEYIKESLYYCSDSGLFYWAKDRPRHHFNSDQGYKMWMSRYAGRLAGCKQKSGYITITIKGTYIYAHRAAWAYVTGRMPDGQIDHINGNRSDNRFSNLRDIEGRLNQKNMKLSSNNTSGATGVIWHKCHSKWVAVIKSNGEQIHIGYFLSKQDAINARKEAEKKHGFHENHGRVI